MMKLFQISSRNKAFMFLFFCFGHSLAAFQNFTPSGTPIACVTGDCAYDFRQELANGNYLIFKFDTTFGMAFPAGEKFLVAVTKVTPGAGTDPVIINVLVATT